MIWNSLQSVLRMRCSTNRPGLAFRGQLKAIHILTQCPSKTITIQPRVCVFSCHPWKRWTRGNSAGSLQQDQHCCNLPGSSDAGLQLWEKGRTRQMEPAWGGGGPKLEKFCRGSRQLFFGKLSVSIPLKIDSLLEVLHYCSNYDALLSYHNSYEITEAFF